MGTGVQKVEVKLKPAVPVRSSETQRKGGPVSSSTKTTAAKPLNPSVVSRGPPPSQKALSRNSTVTTNGTGKSRTSTVSSTNTGPRRGAIPSFSRLASIGRTSSLTRTGEKAANTSVNGTGRNQGGIVNSIGLRNSGTQPAGSSMRISETGVASTNGAARKRTSTLLAPTASSLARKQHTVKPPSFSAKPINGILPTPVTKATVPPAPVSAPVPACAVTPSRIPMFTLATPRQTSNKDGSTTIEKTPGSIFISGPPSFTPSKPTIINGGESNAPKPRPLPGRRPRISRSRVIARVGAQRAASNSNQTNNNGRRSLNTPKTRGSLGVRVSGIGGKTHRESLASTHRRKLRQSEVLRRRSKVSAIGTATVHNNAEDSSEGD